MDSRVLTLDFDVSEQDYDAFYAHFLSTSPFVRRTTRKWQAILSGIGVLVIVAGIRAMYVADARTSAIVTTIIGVSYIIYILVFYPARYHRRWLAQVKKMGTDHPVKSAFGRTTCTIADGTIECQSPIGTIRLPAKNLHACNVTDSHAFLYITGQSAIIIPRRGLDGARFDSFISAVREEMAVASASR